MPSIQMSDMGKSSGGGGGPFSWKVVGAVALITCSVGYGMYQYERFFPGKKAPSAKTLAAAAAQRPPGAARPGDLKATYEKLGLTEDQRRRLGAIDDQSTNALSKMRQASRVLTADQRKQLRDMRAEARKEAQARNQRRQAKYFPNPQDAAYAKAAAQKQRQERQAQKKAAAATGASAQK